MKSAVFFPILNILTILLCTLCGILFFSEKLTVKTVLVLLLGMAAVTVLSL
jgi:multidrug transporter EmrE-like cation transporter